MEAEEAYRVKEREISAKSRQQPFPISNAISVRRTRTHPVGVVEGRKGEEGRKEGKDIFTLVVAKEREKESASPPPPRPTSSSSTAWADNSH